MGSPPTLKCRPALFQSSVSLLPSGAESQRTPAFLPSALNPKLVGLANGLVPPPPQSTWQVC